MCVLAVLGSQGIVVKCTAAILFCTVDSQFIAVLYSSNPRKMTWIQGIGVIDASRPLVFAIHLILELKISQSSQTTLPVLLEETSLTSRCQVTTNVMYI